MRKKYIFPLALKRTQFMILKILLDCDIVTSQDIAQRVYGCEGDHEHLKPRIKVQMTLLRHALRLHGIEIETIRGSGYRMNPEDKQRIRSIIETPPAVVEERPFA